MSQARRDYLFRRIASADPSKATSSVLNGDLDKTYYEMLNSGTIKENIGSPGNRCVYLGDSITRWSDTPSLYSQRVSLANLSSIVSNQRINHAYNAGVAGDTSAQALARFDTDVIPYSPNIVHVLVGTNDSSLTTAQSIANINAIVQRTLRIGAIAALGTLPPKNTTPSERARVAALNVAIKSYARDNGICLIDYQRILLDPATGGYLSSYDSGDHVHPSDSGFVAMANLCRDSLATVIPAWTPALAIDNGDTNNLIANGLFLDSGATGTGRASWTGGTGTGITSTVVSGDSSIIGNWLKWDMAASSATMQCYQNIATAPIGGHKYLFTGKVKTSWTSGANMFTVRNRLTRAGSVNEDRQPMNGMSVTLPDGTFYMEYVAPSDIVSHQVSVLAAAGTGSIQVAQLSLFDLTAIGIA